MSSSKSSPTNTTATTTSLTTSNQNVSGNTGLTNLGGSVSTSDQHNISATENNSSVNNSVTNTTVTDFGAVSAGTALSQSALDLAASVTNRALNTSDQSQETVSKIANTALEANGSVFGQSLTAIQHNTDNTVDVITGLATQFGTALSDFTSQEQTQLGNVVSALNSTYTANNTSANQQVINAVTQSGQQSADVIKYVALAAVAGVVLFLVFRK